MSGKLSTPSCIFCVLADGGSISFYPCLELCFGRSWRLHADNNSSVRSYRQLDLSHDPNVADAADVDRDVGIA